jgi:oligoendopeptidase F
MKKYDSRQDVPLEYRWDLTTFFQSDEEFLNELENTKKQIEKIKKYVGCTKDSKTLKAYLKQDTELMSKIYDLLIYAMTLSDSDLNESVPLEYVGKTDELYASYNVENAFFKPELLALSKEEYNSLFEDEELLKYKPCLDNIYRYKDHIISEEEEKLVSTFTQDIDSYGQLSSSLLNSMNDYGEVVYEDGTKEKLMTTNYRKIMKSLNRDKRKDVYLQYNKVLDQYSGINAGLLNNYVKKYNNISKTYNFASSWEDKLFSNKLSNKVYDALVEACLERKDVYKKFYDIKAKVLGVDEIMPWDQPLELYKVNGEYTIEDAQNMCLEALKPLGEDYISRFKDLINNRAVDYCQYKGKCSGGYNVSSINKRESKILMSFNGDLDSVSTLAHEGGHYVHHTYIYDNNEAMYRDHDSTVCEVASLTNECLLSNYLVQNGTRDEALAGLSNIIGVIMSNLFGAVREGDIERKFYQYALEGGTLTKDYLNELTKESINTYMGSIQHDYQKLGWVTRSHYYMHFYLFSYAICIANATYVAKEILDGNKTMLDNYYKFLSMGSNNDVMDTFKVLGVDLEDKNVYIEAINYLDSLLDEFTRLYESERKEECHKVKEITMKY